MRRRMSAGEKGREAGGIGFGTAVPLSREPLERRVAGSCSFSRSVSAASIRTSPLAARMARRSSRLLKSPSERRKPTASSSG